MGGEAGEKEDIGTGKKTYRVAIVGNPNCGKTTRSEEHTSELQSH